MPNPRRRATRDNTQRDARRRDVAKLYLRGWSQLAIAEKHGVDKGTISRDVAALRAKWLSSALKDFDEAKAQELAKVDHLEQTYWQAWEDSRKERQRTRTSKTGDRATATVEKQTRDGNLAALNGVQWCIEQRCKILGIYEAIKISIDWRKAAEEQGFNAGDLFEQMVNAYIAALDRNASQ